MRKKTGGKSTAANMDEAMEAGRKREQEMFLRQEEEGGSEIQRTPEGDRYRDIFLSSSPASSSPPLKAGDACAIRYRALRLGKRSRDGLSGEASTVFSYGYGEDDDRDGDALEVTIGRSNLIPALEAGLVGMRVGGKRRILVRPERGWFKGKGCGVLEDTDVNNLAAAFIVPGTKITDTEDCLDMTRIPSPTSYAAKRRMGRRFDESLIVEVEVVR
ncbi:hypothetical protein NSK_005316 [Nannochloropsis salina CCMP1776]|uniref:peptidylprolyl isomerase n=1 Tax=Nannochloropsis salina CCMP1776 TaxID=1027361 RepID=A0A4D9CY48_9STRA|nr:hypothetical protein NSK_005316 [Nannochloropsis salina CCMP1776]|eukprot:TFJ83384.1 hypothetical protein NSK_005316 [Nannochloropsis salina CCMP1776]